VDTRRVPDSGQTPAVIGSLLPLVISLSPSCAFGCGPKPRLTTSPLRNSRAQRFAVTIRGSSVVPLDDREGMMTERSA
jgi:hypothetical protein